jgi:hypothetical protein
MHSALLKIKCTLWILTISLLLRLQGSRDNHTYFRSNVCCMLLHIWRHIFHSLWELFCRNPRLGLWSCWRLFSSASKMCFSMPIRARWLQIWTLFPSLPVSSTGLAWHACPRSSDWECARFTPERVPAFLGDTHKIIWSGHNINASRVED